MTTLLEAPPRAARARKNGASEAPGRQVAVVRLTPAEAARMVAEERFDRQRKLSELKVDRMVRAIERGHFPLTMIYRAALLDGRAFILDGQHRLNAIWESDLALEVVLVTEPLATEAEVGRRYGWFDLGHAQRNMEDLLRAHGEADLGQWTKYIARGVDVIAQRFAPVQRDDPAYRESLLGKNDPEQVLRQLQPWLPVAREYIKLAAEPRKGRVKTMHRKGLVAVALVTLADCHDEAVRFWQEVAGGVSDLASPATTLLLTAERLERGSGYGSWPAVARVAWAASAAWNAFLDDRELAQIRVPAAVEKVTIPRTRFAAP